MRNFRFCIVLLTPCKQNFRQEKGHYFIFFCVLLAIVYVLSRTGAPTDCAVGPNSAALEGFDIG
jgi:hypothetical protein